MRRVSRLLLRRLASSASQAVDRFALLGVEVRVDGSLPCHLPEAPHRSPPLLPQRRFDLDATDLHASYKAIMVRARELATRVQPLHASVTFSSRPRMWPSPPLRRRASFTLIDSRWPAPTSSVPLPSKPRRSLMRTRT